MYETFVWKFKIAIVKLQTNIVNYVLPSRIYSEDTEK